VVVRRLTMDSIFVGELDDVEVVDDDGGVRQADADRGAVGGRHVDGDVGDALSPFQVGGGESGQDIADGAAFDLSEQPAVAEGVDEAGVAPVPGQAPLAGIRILFPARPSAAGLVDAQDGDLRQRCRGDVAACVGNASITVGKDRCRHGRQGQMQTPRGRDDCGAGIPYAAPGRTPQPGGQLSAYGLSSPGMYRRTSPAVRLLRSLARWP
jgi:hypothetical protein